MSPAWGSVLVLVLLLQTVVSAVPPYAYDGYASEDFPMAGPSEVDRGDLSLDPYLHGMNKDELPAFEIQDGRKQKRKRSCVRRGGRCDHRPDDCCSGGACRCNLWGTNCQCQRMGIFQKWG